MSEPGPEQPGLADETGTLERPPLEDAVPPERPPLAESAPPERPLLEEAESELERPPLEEAEAELQAGPSVVPRVPTVRETVRTALNAIVASSGELRLLSVVAVAFGVVLVAAPLGAATAFGITFPLFSSFGAVDDAMPALLGILALVCFLAGLVGLFVFFVQFPLLVVAVVGGEISGRPLDLRQGLRRARQVFWRAVGASFVVGLVAGVPAGIIGIVALLLLGETQLGLGVNVLVSLIFASPWVYVLPGLVLGGVGAVEALRRSWRLARFKWRLALTIALLAVLGGQIVYAAAFSVIGAVLTIVSFAPGEPSIPAEYVPFVVAGVALVGTVIVTSLSFATQVVQVAPQTSGFYALTNYAAGLDEARLEPREPLLRWPALVTYSSGLAATLGLALGLVAVWPIPERGPWQRVDVERLSLEVPAGWTREHGPVDGAFTNGADGHMSIVLGPRSVMEAAERHFATFIDVEEAREFSSEEITLGGTTVREATFVGFLEFPPAVLPALVESGRIATADVAIVVSYPEGPTSDLYLGEAKRFAHHIWMSLLSTP